MSFGVSVGDILAVIEIGTKTYKALKDGPAELKDLSLECRSLTETLTMLHDEAESPTSLYHRLPPSREQHLRTLLHDCGEGMNKLRALVTKYQTSSEKLSFSKKLRLALDNTQSPRDKLAIHTASINMFLTSLGNGSLGRLEFLLANRSQSFIQTGPSSQYGGQTTRDPNAPSIADPPSERGFWEEMRQDLAKDGITGAQLSMFQEDLKAYARYLVRGDTPFWKNEFSQSARPSSALSSQPESIASLGRAKKHGKIPERARLEKQRLEEEKARMDLDWELGRAKTELEYKGSESKSRTSTSSDELSVSDIIAEFDSLFDLDNLEPDVKKMRVSSPSPPRSSPKVIYHGDDDLPPSPSSAPPPPPATLYPRDPYLNTPLDSSTRYSSRPSSQEHMPIDTADAIYDERKRLTRYKDEYDGRSGSISRDRENYLKHKAIPRCEQELAKLMKISQDPAIKWRHRCNVCRYFIAGARRHCGICKEGDFDLCEQCWNKGKGCLDEVHVMKLIDM
ncbi:Hypothetical protein D9617_33g038100 [Elsinoe fawcettii]|nr:Hypothetical protein D9617_33g038100 [Elsinoe fawcettii]